MSNWSLKYYYDFKTWLSFESIHEATSEGYDFLFCWWEFLYDVYVNERSLLISSLFAVEARNFAWMKKGEPNSKQAFKPGKKNHSENNIATV